MTWWRVRYLRGVYFLPFRRLGPLVLRLIALARWLIWESNVPEAAPGVAQSPSLGFRSGAVGLGNSINRMKTQFRSVFLLLNRNYFCLVSSKFFADFSFRLWCDERLYFAARLRADNEFLITRSSKWWAIKKKVSIITIFLLNF